jgi:hypothetical protein
VGFGCSGFLRSITTIAMKPIAMSTAVPKNGPRQLIEPSAPPSSGPTAMPRPRAASYRMIALEVPPDAAPTIVASAVEMKSAFPSPHPPRKPMMDSTFWLSPAAAAKITMSASPISSVFFAPMRLETQLVKNIATPVTSR